MFCHNNNKFKNRSSIVSNTEHSNCSRWQRREKAKTKHDTNCTIDVKQVIVRWTSVTNDEFDCFVQKVKPSFSNEILDNFAPSRLQPVHLKLCLSNYLLFYFSFQNDAPSVILGCLCCVGFLMPRHFQR